MSDTSDSERDDTSVDSSSSQDEAFFIPNLVEYKRFYLEILKEIEENGGN